MKTLKSFSALADVIVVGDNLSDGPKYCTSLYAHSSGESRSGRVSRVYSAAITLPRARGTGGKYGARGRTVYRVSITRD